MQISRRQQLLPVYTRLGRTDRPWNIAGGARLAAVSVDVAYDCVTLWCAVHYREQ